VSEEDDEIPICDLLKFVELSGGIEKVRKVSKALLGIASRQDSHEIQSFIRGVSNNPEGAKKLLAAAMLGFRCAESVWTDIE
jgi:hypothetical protein